MSNIYVDPQSGDDTTGDGSAALPYKTINKATTGLSGGDEVRVKASSANTSLTGTLAFTDGSSSVTGSGTLFTTEAGAGSYILGPDGMYYRVNSVSSNEALTLTWQYRGDTASGVSSEKLSFLSLAASTWNGTVNSSGSLGSNILITGGWDLATETKTGISALYDGTSDNYGREAIYGSSKEHVKVEDFIFIYFGRQNSYAGTVTFSGADGIEFDNVHLYYTRGQQYGTGTGFNITYASDAVKPLIAEDIYFARPYRLYNSDTPSFNSFSYCRDAYIKNSRFINGYSTNNSNAFIASNCQGMVCENVAVKGNTQQGVVSLSNVTFVNSEVSDNGTYGIVGSAFDTFNLINTLVDGNTTADFNLQSAYPYGKLNKVFSAQDYQQVSGDHRIYFQQGYTKRNTAVAYSDQCLEFLPGNASLYISQSFFFPANSGTGYTLNFKTRNDSSFDGDISIGAKFNGVTITAFADKTPSSDDTWEDKTVVIDSGDITADGIIELIVKVRGTTGSAFIDELSAE